MMNFIKNHFGPANCDDDKLLKRMKRAWVANSWTNLYGCCGSFSIMGSAVAGIAMIFGMPGIVPLVLLGGGAAVLATGVPLIKLTDKIEDSFNREAQKRGLWKREWDEDYEPPCPHEEAFYRMLEEERAAKKMPVLADVFDPQAAVTLGESVKAMPSIKLKQQGYTA